MDYRHTLPEGTLLDGHYRIDRVIGVGGFGVTYAAVDTQLDLPVAIKEYFPAEFGTRDSALIVRAAADNHKEIFDHCRNSFMREGRTLAQFRHPAIVRVLWVFEANGTAYMAMEYEQGRNLADWAQALGRAPTQREIDAIVTPLVSALALMHASDFIHRDIAPDNIIVRADGRPVLLDFGSARRVIAEASRNLTGIVKHGFSPPEQYSVDPKLQGPWSDIYALGAVLYLLVSGVPPAPAPDRQLGTRLKPAAAAARGTYRPGFLAAIDLALELSPNVRPRSLTALTQLLAGTDPQSGAQTEIAPQPRRRPDRDTTTLVPDRAARENPPAAPLRSPPPPQPKPAPQPEPRTGPETAPPSKLPEVPPPKLRPALVVLPVIAAIFLFLAWQLGSRWIDVLRPAGSPQARIDTAPPAPAPAPAPSLKDQQRLDAERAEAERQRAAAQAEAERQQREAATRAEAERRAAEDRRLDAERVEAERQRQAAERQRLEAERLRQEAATAVIVLISDLRRELSRIGCNSPSTGTTWTLQDRQAMERFSRTAGITLAGFEARPETLPILQGITARVCLPTCKRGEVLVGEVCVPQTPAARPPAAPSQTAQCNEINERAQLGQLSEADLEILRTLRCR